MSALIERAVESVLLVDDDENDVLFFRRGLLKAAPNATLSVCCDGEEATRFFERKGQFADEAKYPWPSMLVTDVKMPRMGGLELLKWLREHPHFRVKPTIVFSSAQHPTELAEAYTLGIDSYVVKPSGTTEYAAAVAALVKFWRSPDEPSPLKNWTP